MFQTKIFPLFFLLISLCSSVLAAPINEPDTTPDKSPQPPVAKPVEEARGDFPFVPDNAGAWQAFHAGKFDECMSHLRGAVAKDPTLPPAKLVLAGMFLSAGHRAAGRRLLEELAARDVKRPELHMAFGRLALAERRLADAILHFEKAELMVAESRAPEEEKQAFSNSILQARTIIAEQRADWSKAQDLLSQLVQSKPNDARLRDRWAGALFNSGRLSDAFDQFDIAYRQDGTLNRPEMSMAAIHMQRGEYNKANGWYAKALAAHPDDPDVHFDWAVALSIQDRAAEAEIHAEKAASLGLESTELTFHRGRIARQLGKYGKAQQYLTLVLKEARNHDEAFYHLIMSLCMQDKQEQAAALKLAQERGKRAHSPWSLTALGWAQHVAGEHAQAERTLAEVAGGHPEPLYLLGRFFAEQGKDKEARAVAHALQQVINQPGLFVMRSEAREWMEKTLKESD